MKKVKMKNGAGTEAEFPENQVDYMAGHGWEAIGPAVESSAPASTYADVEPVKPKPETVADNATPKPAKEANNGTR